MQAETTFSHEDCSAFMDGLLGTGLHGAIQHLTEDALDIVGTYKAEASSESGLVTSGARRDRLLGRFTSTKAQQFRKLAGTFVDSGLYEATAIHRQLARDVVRRFLSWQLTACVLFVLALGAVHLWSNRTAIQALDTEMKRVRGLTLLLPETVVRGIPAIREEVEKNLAGADTAALDRTAAQAAAKGAVGLSVR